MNKILFIAFLLVTSLASAATFSPAPKTLDNERWVTTTGSDANNCTASKPCTTLARACTVSTRAGTLIRIGAGTFNFTTACNLNLGVSIKGSGQGVTIVTSNITSGLGYLISAVSTAEGTVGNHEISDMTMDGLVTGLNGIYVQARSNVKIYNITAQNWLNNFITVSGREANDYAPKKFSVGNEIYNNTITNSDRWDGGSYTAAIRYGGQDSIKIYKNTITSNRGTSTLTGWPIKYFRGGFSKNDKIYDNNLWRADPDGTGGFPFLIELWNSLGGTEVYSNTMTGGGIDFAYASKGDSTYSIDFHDNVVGYNVLWTGGGIPFGILGEYNSSDLIIRGNYFYNLGASGRAIGIFVGPTAGFQYNNYKIFNNICVDSKFIATGNNNLMHRFDNWLIANNTIINQNTGATAIDLPAYGKITNFQIRNNIVRGFVTAAVEYQGTSLSTLDDMVIEGNNFFNNGNSNLLRTVSATNVPTNVIQRNNVTTDPQFINVATNVAASSFTVGTMYQISAVGTTNFVAIGARSNTVGVNFVATGAGTGTGTAHARDFRIALSSPARNIGVDIGLLYDYRGIFRTDLPDAGAVEYNEQLTPTNIGTPQLLH